MKATLNFNTIQNAKEFARKWASHTLTGYDMTSVRPNGSVGVTVYNVTESRRVWIDAYVEACAR